MEERERGSFGFRIHSWYVVGVFNELYNGLTSISVPPSLPIPLLRGVVSEKPASDPFLCADTLCKWECSILQASEGCVVINKIHTIGDELLLRRWRRKVVVNVRTREKKG